MGAKQTTDESISQHVTMEGEASAQVCEHLSPSSFVPLGEWICNPLTLQGTSYSPSDVELRAIDGVDNEFIESKNEFVL